MSRKHQRDCSLSGHSKLLLAFDTLSNLFSYQPAINVRDDATKISASIQPVYVVVDLSQAVAFVAYRALERRRCIGQCGSVNGRLVCLCVSIHLLVVNLTGC